MRRFLSARLSNLIGISLLLLMAIMSSHVASAQSNNLSGSIVGTVTDPTGAVVANATITIKSLNTNLTRSLTTDTAGVYHSGPLPSGPYEIDIAAPGMSDIKATDTVQIGSVSTANYKMKVGSTGETVNVTTMAVQVSQGTIAVSDVISQEQISTLPVQGRNFLDLAQLEPGVVLQSGLTFDPTKAGYSALSIGGIAGRTTRISLDGSDITDETVGTTIFNIPSGAVNEYQLTRATADVSTDLTTSGSLSVVTPSGTNTVHGQLFYQFSDQRVGAANTAGGQHDPFQRNQFGGFIGGPIVRDKLFLFADSERIKQDAQSPIQLGTTFSALNAKYPSIGTPFRDTYTVGRMDYNAPHGVHMFARANYESNSDASTYGYAYSLYANRDNTYSVVGGADWTNGPFTHSIRGGYEKFHNLIADKTAGSSGLYDPIPGIEIGDFADNVIAGPNLLAPQQTYQSEKQLRYDGSWTHGNQTIRYGYSINRILGGGFASFFGLGPLVTFDASSYDPSAPGASTGNPLDYLPTQVTMGNGEGYDTEIAAFGATAGGQGDWRQGAYLADTWKASSRLTVVAGIRYQRDTGRNDADLAPIPCSAAGSLNPCSTAPGSDQQLLDQFGNTPGLGNRVHQPNFDFGPQLGFSYSLTSSGKTVLQAGVGEYFENFVFNNVLFDRPEKLAKGLFFSDTAICGGTNSYTNPQGGTITTYNGETIAAICAEPIGVSGPKFAGLEKQYQTETKAEGPAGNGAFVGQTLSIAGLAGYDAYAPNTFRTPRSLHFEVGVQHELKPGMVLTVNYIHQHTWDIMQVIDANHVGDAQYFNSAAATAAVAATLAQCGATSVVVQSHLVLLIHQAM